MSTNSALRCATEIILFILSRLFRFIRNNDAHRKKMYPKTKWKFRNFDFSIFVRFAQSTVGGGGGATASTHPQLCHLGATFYKQSPFQSSLEYKWSNATLQRVSSAIIKDYWEKSTWERDFVDYSRWTSASLHLAARWRHKCNRTTYWRHCHVQTESDPSSCTERQSLH